MPRGATTARIDPATGKQRRGFAAMHPIKRQEIARLGGKAQPADAKSFRKNPELARQAGSKGGSHSRAHLNFKDQ